MELRSLKYDDLPSSLSGHSVLMIAMSAHCWLLLNRIVFKENFREYPGTTLQFADVEQAQLHRHPRDPFFSQTLDYMPDQVCPDDLGLNIPQGWTCRSFADTDENLYRLRQMVLERDIALYAKLVGVSEQNVRAYSAHATAVFLKNAFGADEAPVH